MEIGINLDNVLKAVIKTVVTEGSPEMANALVKNLDDAADQLMREFMTGDAGSVRFYADEARKGLEARK